jgi:2-keto-4-pentenoate hydratase/2-oxohepta-3-ene-1,7-dioic acid hydratase in catechol pathway
LSGEAGELPQEYPNFPQWCRVKGFDTFGCLGPSIADIGTLSNHLP